MSLRWMLGCLVMFLTACPHGAPPSTDPNSPAAVCRPTAPAGTAVPGGSLLHGATFWMVQIETCGFDTSQLLPAAAACAGQGKCGIELDQSGLTVVSNVLNSELTPITLAGGPAFRAKVGAKSYVLWDVSRDPRQLLPAINQAGGVGGDACCPGCSTCDPAAATGAQCPAPGSAPKIDRGPAPGFPPLPGPAVCTCSAVCSAKAANQLPASCECSNLCHCP